MRQFIKDALSENGSASSKRIAFWIFVAAFLLQCLANMIWKLILDATLRDQLYYAMLILLGAIVGVTVVNSYKDIKIAQSVNNATTGNPTPPPETKP